MSGIEFLLIDETHRARSFPGPAPLERPLLPPRTRPLSADRRVFLARAGPGSPPTVRPAIHLRSDRPIRAIVAGAAWDERPRTHRRSTTVTTWAEFEAAAPALAARGRELLHRGDAGEALLATVRDDEPPRIHPINVAHRRRASVRLHPGVRQADGPRARRPVRAPHPPGPGRAERVRGPRSGLARDVGRRSVGCRGRVVVRGRRDVHALRVLDLVGPARRAPDGGRLAAPVHEVERRLTAARDLAASVQISIPAFSPCLQERSR